MTIELRWQDPGSELVQEDLALRCRGLQARWHLAERELDHPVVEQRRADLEGIEHAGAVDLDQYVLRQIAQKITACGPLQQVRRRGYRPRADLLAHQRPVSALLQQLPAAAGIEMHRERRQTLLQ